MQDFPRIARVSRVCGSACLPNRQVGDGAARSFPPSKPSIGADPELGKPG